MRTLEVHEKGWPQFCRKIEEFCRGAMISIEIQDSQGAKTAIAQDLPLRALGLVDEKSSCNTNLVIEAGLPDQKPIRHVVIEPIHIRLRNGNGGDRYNRLQISAENGTTTVDLHPGLNQELLKGLDLVA